MKRVIVVLLLILVCSVAFTADMKIGVLQNVLNTSFLLDTEFKHFGVEAAVGLPVVFGVADILQLDNGEGNEDSSSEAEASTFAVPAGIMVNAYAKVIDKEKFSLRLGLQADLVGLFSYNYLWCMCFTGASVGLDFRFTDSFGMNLTSAMPLAMLFSPIDVLAEKTFFSYISDEDTHPWGADFMAFAGSLGSLMNQLVRLSFKWKI